ncbi:MAG: glycosyltransferase family 2 protein [Deltaproteobacteria bacterium]|nr:glycosyltransferase family 2 protein [Deltaproteobacteria bacterium]
MPPSSDQPGDSEESRRDAHWGSGASYAGDAPLFSVVVPTWHGAMEWLGECLEGIRAQREHVPEVLVVFDGPAEEARALTRRILPAARHLPFRDQRGFAAAASAGLRAARGRLVALLNDDAVAQPDWLESMADAADRHPNVGSFASRVLRADDPSMLDSAGHGLTRWGEPFALGHGSPDGPPFHVERPVFGAPACAAVYRWELLRDVGAFDVDFGAYLEDVDLSLRAQVMGFSCLYVPSARVFHRGSSSYGWGPDGDGTAERLVARNRVRLMLKSMPRNALRAAAIPALASIAADLAWRAVPGSDAHHGAAALVGTLEGLRDARASVAARGPALGGRRVDDEAVRRVLGDAEAHLQEMGGAGGGRARRLQLAQRLARWVDRREERIKHPLFATEAS